MFARSPWRTLARCLLLATAAGCGLAALFVLSGSQPRWPSGPYAAARAQGLADLATALISLGVGAAGAIHNARRIAQGETLLRAPAAFAGGVGIFLAMLSIWLLGLIGIGLVTEPIRRSNQNWLAGVAVAPLLVAMAAAGWPLLAACFGDRPPGASETIGLLRRALAYAALASGVLTLLAAAQADKAGQALIVAAPTALGLIGIGAAIAAAPQGGWPSLLAAVLGYLGGAFCALALSLAGAGFFTAYDPRAALLLGIVLVPVGSALFCAYALAIAIAAGRALALVGRLRRAFP